MPDSEVRMKRVSHRGLPIEDRADVGWAMSREVYAVGAGEAVEIGRTSKWCAVSLANIIKLAKTQNITL